MSDLLGREQLLSLSPDSILSPGLRGGDAVDPTGLRDELRTMGALAMGEQIRHAGVPIEALEACAVALDQARDFIPPDGVVEEPDRARIAAGLALQCQGYAALIRVWLDELVRRVSSRADLDAAIRMVEHALQLWRINEALRAADPRSSQ